MSEKPVVIALAGNPNVGKSTLFNALTHLHQHTGNWPGKTVAIARGSYTYRGDTYLLVDLPGTYSLCADSAEEEITRDFLRSGLADVTLVVSDATCLMRNLTLLLQIMEECSPVVLCVNLMDEAKKKGITVDLTALQDALGIPVLGVTAASGEGLSALCAALYAAAHYPIPPPQQEPFACEENAAQRRAERAHSLCAAAVTMPPNAHRLDRRLDRILTSRRTGMAAMLLLLTGVFYLTVIGANAPSRLLANILFSLQQPLHTLLLSLSLPPSLCAALSDGMYRALAWVISVMLPPMAIFFPLFTLLEDAGYLPRVAFNLDRCLQWAGAHGRQSLTMCMSLGCNACAVTGCRIIDSPRHRLLAMLTASFIPCNGRFPMLLALIVMFFAPGSGAGSSFLSAVILLGTVAAAVGMTLLISRFLSATVLRGEAASFTLELPPYRKPRIGQVLLRSLFDRTLFVLGRAAAVAAPAGLVIWLLANTYADGLSLLHRAAAALAPLGQLMGLDGMILLAFLLGFPAGEIVIPILLMGYLSTGTLTDYTGFIELRNILVANGWTVETALCTLLFALFHFPCSTTCLTIRKETGSFGWTALAILLPTAVGAALCMAVHLAFSLFA